MFGRSGRRSGLDEDVPAAVPGEPEGELARPPQGLADRAMPPGGGHQQEEAAAAGPQQLAAGGAVAPGRLVPLVDPREADPEAERSLQLPTGVQQRGEMVEVAGTGQRRAHLVGQVAHLEEYPAAGGGLVRLLLEDPVGAARLARVEQQAPALQLVEGL